jgi:hypothetical protein
MKNKSHIFYKYSIYLPLVEKFFDSISVAMLAPKQFS